MKNKNIFFSHIHYLLAKQVLDNFGKMFQMCFTDQVKFVIEVQQYYCIKEKNFNIYFLNK